jgi:hypothetical protein
MLIAKKSFVPAAVALALCGLTVAGGVAGQGQSGAKAVAVKSRTFLFTYATSVIKAPKNQPVKLWLPLPQSTVNQDVTIEKQAVSGKSSMGNDPEYGNRILFVEALPDKDDTVNVEMTFKVTRREFRSDAGAKQQPGAKENIDRFLQADKLVPLTGKPLDLIKDEKLGPTPLETAKILYNVVNHHMKYSKEGVGWGNGDALWACDSKFGNCTDFHSLFISLARANKIPAKFEMGFAIPKERGEGTVGGYHCWAWVLADGKGWVPVDISEANRFPELADYYFSNLCENRVLFTTGRDINLVPKQGGPPLNFFIYPYGEVNRQPLAADQLRRSFSYKDVSE